jgi:hypothetical protein
MEMPVDLDALALAGGRVVFRAGSRTLAPGHDIPHPIGDPDEDDELPGDDEEDENDEDDEDGEEPMQLGRACSDAYFAPQHKI